MEESSFIERTCLSIYVLSPVGKTKLNRASSATGQKGKAREEGRAKRWERCWRRNTKEYPPITYIFFSKDENFWSGGEQSVVLQITLSPTNLPALPQLTKPLVCTPNPKSSSGARNILCSNTIGLPQPVILQTQPLSLCHGLSFLANPTNTRDHLPIGFSCLRRERPEKNVQAKPRYR